MQAGVGQHQAGVIQTDLTPEQQIEIQRSRPPTLFNTTITAEMALERLQQIQQRQRRTLRRGPVETLHQHHRIAVAGLIRRTPHRVGIDQVGPAEPQRFTGPLPQLSFQERPHRQQRVAGRPSRTLPIRPERNGQC